MACCICNIDTHNALCTQCIVFRERFDDKEYLDLLIKRIEETPDTRYVPDNDEGDCFYDRGKCTDGTTGCVHGQVLRQMGAPPRLLACTKTIGHILTWLDAEPEIDVLACRIQRAQDAGRTWGQALEAARADVPSLS